MAVSFFKTPSQLRAWLEQHHDGARELWVGFHKTGSKKGGITSKEALDEALCFGWIDGIRKGIDHASYTIRFSPRKAKTYWSLVNIAHARALIKQGRMAPPGLKAFNDRDQDISRKYSYERKAAAFEGHDLERFSASKMAWDFFQKQAPWYQRTATFWVLSAKREKTRAKRLDTLIEDSANGRRIGLLAR